MMLLRPSHLPPPSLSSTWCDPQSLSSTRPPLPGPSPHSDSSFPHTSQKQSSRLHSLTFCSSIPPTDLHNTFSFPLFLFFSLSKISCTIFVSLFSSIVPPS